MDGVLAGVVFEGRGDAMRSDQTGFYGGTVYGWDQWSVQVMVPSFWTTSRGFAVRMFVVKLLVFGYCDNNACAKRTGTATSVERRRREPARAISPE